MENLIAASAVDTVKINGIDISKERHTFLLMLALNKISTSMNEVTITSKDRIEISFGFEQVIGRELVEEMETCVWDVILRIFGQVCVSEIDRIVCISRLGIKIDQDSWSYGYTVRIPRKLLQDCSPLNQEKIKCNLLEL